MTILASRPCEHVAAFYQTDDFLADRVASFIADGLSAGEQVIVLATRPHWTAILARLSSGGVAFPRALAEGRLLLLDASDVLDGLTIDGRVSVEGFRAALGRFVAPGVKQRIYGEIVSLLVARGDLETAVAIESVGHELAHLLHIPVLCGYSVGGDQPLAPYVTRRLEAIHDRSWSEGQTPVQASSVDPDVVSATTRLPAVQFYESRESLAKRVGTFLGEGFAAGSPAIVIATPEHREAIAIVLDRHYFDVPRLQAAKELIMVDAADLLHRFMRSGMPDATAFQHAMNPLVEQGRRQGDNCTVRAYGEMVDLLWQGGRTAAAIRLEMLWTGLAQTHGFALLGGYAIGHFCKPAEAVERKDVGRQPVPAAADPDEPYTVQ